MTTDTPRTDAMMVEEPDGLLIVTADFARELERDLSECRAALAERQAALREITIVWDRNSGRVFESMGSENPHKPLLILLTPPAHSPPRTRTRTRSRNQRRRRECEQKCIQRI